MSEQEVVTVGTLLDWLEGFDVDTEIRVFVDGPGTIEGLIDSVDDGRLYLLIER